MTAKKNNVKNTENPFFLLFQIFFIKQEQTKTIQALPTNVAKKVHFMHTFLFFFDPKGFFQREILPKRKKQEASGLGKQLFLCLWTDRPPLSPYDPCFLFAHVLLRPKKSLCPQSPELILTRWLSHVSLRTMPFFNVAQKIPLTDRRVFPLFFIITQILTVFTGINQTKAGALQWFITSVTQTLHISKRKQKGCESRKTER